MTKIVAVLLVTSSIALAQDIGAAITGSGTANFIAKWSSSTNLTVSALCQSASGGLVGIGTCSPTQRLQINSGNVVVKGINNFTAKGQTANYYVGDTNHSVGATFAGGLYFSTYKAPKAMVINDTVVTQDGSTFANIGLGTTTPSALIDIEPGNVHCQSDACVHGTTLFNVSNSIRVDLLGTTYLGNPNSDGVLLITGLTFPDGTTQTTAYTGTAATKQAAVIQQLLRDRDNLIRIVQQLQARVEQLEKTRR
jgi:hypothetical protein